MGCRPGPGKLGQTAKTFSHCDVTSRKHQIQSEKNFFSISNRILAESAEGLKNSLALAVGKLFDCQTLQKKWRTRDLKGET